MTHVLAAEDLLAGAQATHRIEIPAELLARGSGSGSGSDGAPGFVVLRPSIGAAYPVSERPAAMNSP